jgi:nucleoside-diphosphate-sugar epimerase
MAPQILMYAPTIAVSFVAYILFRTGSTGYIGGSVLAAITKAHPEYSVTAILRKVSQHYVDAYPRVKTIVGDYDSADILAKAASESDIIIRMSIISLALIQLC